ncbi:uncharacterized protein METZ01_LOCUS410128 [marine metagenome]|uniref:Uncharacterized protein n=1 Tax=marine metagenome TaxID=408172 RepID=A0A382WF79_9ZZZZ
MLEILQLLCASFSAYGYPPILFFSILFKINLKSLSVYPEPKSSILINGNDSTNLAKTDEIIIFFPNLESS